MHSESIIKCKIVKVGTKVQSYPIWVIARDDSVPNMYKKLFYIEIGSDGSVYTNFPNNLVDLSIGEGAEATLISQEKVENHKYLSFHSSGFVNHPARDDFELSMPFSINEQINRCTNLFQHRMGIPSGYENIELENTQDYFVIDDYSEHINNKMFPVITVDISSYNGEEDEERIKKEAGEDNLISFGLLSKEVVPYNTNGITTKIFLRLKLHSTYIEDKSLHQKHMIYSLNRSSI